MSNSPEEERVTSAKRIYDGKVVNLRVDTVVLPGGKMAQREVVEHRGAVAIIPLKDDQTVIMVRQWRTPARASLLEIPAGSLDVGEDAGAAAMRELGEEINFQAGRMTRLFETYMAPGYSTEIIYYYLAEDLTPFQGEPDEDEDIEVVEVPLSEVMDRIRSGEIHDAKSVSGLLFVERIRREGAAE